MNAEQFRHVQQTFLSLGDEFLVQYFLSAHKEFRGNQILSRLFSMGHSLEIYLKAALVDEEGVPPHGHDIPRLLVRFDDALSLTTEEREAGEQLFSTSVSNFDLGLYEKHQEALELYQAEYFIRDLKYYLQINQEVIFPVRHSLKPINMRYLNLVKDIRGALKYKPPQQDDALIDLVSRLGFETNPATYVAAPD